MLIELILKNSGKKSLGVSEMNDSFGEIKRLGDTIDMMLTMHSVLRDRYKGWACALDISLVTTSVLLLVTGFVDPTFLKGLKIPQNYTIIGSKICAITIFIVSLITLRVDWKGRVAEHEKACESLARLKGKTKEVLLDKGLSEELAKEHQQLCNLTIGGLCKVPEDDFHRLKAYHVKKVALSKMISDLPGTPVWILRTKLVLKGIFKSWYGTKNESGSGNTGEAGR
jgi:hypothetical protein